MDYINIVCAFLEQEPGGISAFRVPVAEIGVSSVIDEVAAPCAFYVADDAGINDFLHFHDDGKMTHIVSHEQLGSGSHSGFQQTVTSLDCDCHRFFEVEWNSRFQNFNSDFFM